VEVQLADQRNSMWNGGEDNIDVRIEGMSQNVTTKDFEDDLYEGETLGEVISLQTTDPDWTFSRVFCVVLLSILTFGLYLVWLFCCKCCRPKKVELECMHFCVTSYGRVFHWHTGSNGMQTSNCCCCIRGNRTINSATQFSWFNLEDVTMTQFFWTNSQSCFGLLNCLPCCGPRYRAILRFFFKKRPSTSEINSLTPDGSLLYPSVVTDDKLNVNSELSGAPAQRGKPFAFAKNSISKFVSSLNPLAKFDDKSVFEVEGHAGGREELFSTLCKMKAKCDQYIMKDKKDVVKTPTEYPFFDISKTFQPLFTSEQTTVKEYSMNEISKVHINADYCPITESETVIDAIASANRWSWSDIILTILTFGLRYIFFVRHKLRAKRAVVLTSKRLIEISHFTPSGDPYENPSLIETRSYVLTSPKDAMIKDSKAGSFCNFSFKGGSIQIDPRPDAGYPWQAFPVSYRKRVHGFYRNFFTCKSDQKEEFPSFAVPQHEYSMAEGATDVEPLLRDEERILGSFMSKENYSPWPLFGCFPCVLENFCLIKCLSCTIRPLEWSRNVFVTNKRIFSVASNHSSSCLAFCCRKKDRVVYATDLKNVNGFRITGESSVSENCLTRCCGCIPLPCFQSTKSNLVLEVSSGASFAIKALQQKGHSFKVAQGGALMENQDVSFIRKLINNALGAAMKEAQTKKKDKKDKKDKEDKKDKKDKEDKKDKKDKKAKGIGSEEGEDNQEDKVTDAALA